MKILFSFGAAELDDNLYLELASLAFHATYSRGLRLPAQAISIATLALYTRLEDHIRTIGSADNLDLDDFQCRYLVVRSAWVETAEDLLIDWFRPVWNKETKVCQGFGKHGDSADTRANKRSPWDALHAGRAWATSKENTPSKKTVAEIRADIAEHFKKHPPKK